MSESQVGLSNLIDVGLQVKFDIDRAGNVKFDIDGAVNVTFDRRGKSSNIECSSFPIKYLGFSALEVSSTTSHTTLQ